MFDELFAKTFLLVAGMLAITTVTARINKAYETLWEAIFTIGGTFVFLFAITFYSDVFPLNIILVGIFSAIVGWSLGPTIAYIGYQFKLKKYLKKHTIKSKKDSDKKLIYYRETDSGEIDVIDEKEWRQIIIAFESEIVEGNPYSKEWQNIVFQTMSATTLAILATASLVFLTNIDFSFLGGFLFIALILLIIVSLLNYFIFKSRFLSLLKAYFGVVIFTLYLIFDFDRLRAAKQAGDSEWSTAIDIAVNLYLDIINLFLYLLEIFAE
tara:strand:- start:435 stop:1238 length:804 start_codon:yes stop_codon:yes gene_type:complete